VNWIPAGALASSFSSRALRASSDRGRQSSPSSSNRQGYGDYFGVYLSGTKLGEVGVEHREEDARGGDAQARQSALLKLPGFSAGAKRSKAR
jgi:hypothetical protein